MSGALHSYQHFSLTMFFTFFFHTIHFIHRKVTPMSLHLHINKHVSFENHHSLITADTTTLPYDSLLLLKPTLLSLHNFITVPSEFSSPQTSGVHTTLPTAILTETTAGFNEQTSIFISSSVKSSHVIHVTDLFHIVVALF